MQARVNTYLRAVTPLGRESEWVGPFLATSTPQNSNPYLNYAVPDDDAVPTDDDVDALVRWYWERDRKPRLEYVAAAAPAVEGMLRSAGFVVEGRLPLMAYQQAVAPAVPTGVVVRVPSSDQDLSGMANAQAEAYGSSPPSTVEIDERRAALQRGAIALIAEDVASGAVVAAGSCSPVLNGVTEVAAVGVIAGYRRRGIACALAHQLATRAMTAGADAPFLMVAADIEQRVYERAGFVTVGEILHISHLR